MGKRVAIAAIGTMGDVQPFVALNFSWAPQLSHDIFQRCSAT